MTGPTTVWNKPTNIHDEAQNEEIARAIMKCTDPVKMKRWGDKIPDSPEWNQRKGPLMKELVSIKIKTCQEAQHTLLTSGDAILVEAVEDPIWASGLNYKATLKVHPEEWPGQNIIGQLWMDERKRLVRNQPPPSREERQQEVNDEESHPQASDTAENQSTRSEDENLKFLIIGNSNARDMAGILCNKGSKSSGVVMPGANIDAVAEAAQRMSHTKPDFLVLQALPSKQTTYMQRPRKVVIRLYQEKRLYNVCITSK